MAQGDISRRTLLAASGALLTAIAGGLSTIGVGGSDLRHRRGRGGRSSDRR